MEDSEFAVDFGVQYGRGGIRITGSDTVYAPNLRIAWQKADAMRARHEQVLFVNRVVRDCDGFVTPSH